MKYRLRKKLLLAFLVSYCVLGFTSQYIFQREVYPFFNWSFFSDIPNEYTTYTMWVHRYGDEVYEPPLQYSEIKFIFAAVESDPTMYRSRINDLGRAIDHENSADIESLTQKLSEIFAHNKFEYSLVEVRYDPLEYYKYQKYKSTEILAVFSNE